MRLIFFVGGGGGSYCAVPETLHTHPMEGHRKFLEGGGVLEARIGAKFCNSKTIKTA